MSIFINDIIVFFDFKALLPVSGRKVSHISVTHLSQKYSAT